MIPKEKILLATSEYSWAVYPIDGKDSLDTKIWIEGRRLLLEVGFEAGVVFAEKEIGDWSKLAEMGTPEEWLNMYDELIEYRKNQRNNVLKHIK